MLLAASMGLDGEVLPCECPLPWESFGEYMLSDGLVPFIIIFAVILTLVLVGYIIRFYQNQCLIIPRFWWIWLVLAIGISLLLPYIHYGFVVRISRIC